MVVLLLSLACSGICLKSSMVIVLNLLVGVLHGEEVVVAAVRIDPVAGGDHAVRGERRDHVVDDVGGRQAQARSHLAPYVQLQCRDSRGPAESAHR